MLLLLAPGSKDEGSRPRIRETRPCSALLRSSRWVGGRRFAREAEGRADRGGDVVLPGRLALEQRGRVLDRPQEGGVGAEDDAEPSPWAGKLGVGKEVRESRYGAGGLEDMRPRRRGYQWPVLA